MADVQIKYTKLFINNEWVDALSGKTFATINPATKKKLADVAEGDKKDIDRAVLAAKNAFSRKGQWRNADASARGRLLYKLADLFERDLDYLSKLETLNNGKPLINAQFEVKACAQIFRYYAGYCDKVHGETIPSDGPFFTLTRKEPVGVVGQIIPWNYPLLMLSWKWAPAIAAGCTLVMKPAEQTPLSALAAAALSQEAGFPPGVINIVNGFGHTAGAAVANHSEIRKIAFTGSTEVGRKIMEASGRSNLKKVTLELGGKSPLVVFNDANLDEAVELAYQGVFANQGQCCCAGTRTFVQSGIYDEFVNRAAAKARARKVGNPFSAGIEQGPQIDQPSYDKVIRLIKSGVEQGAKLQTGGSAIGTDGFFIEPTVFSDVTDAMDIAKEEIFGPVQSILKFDTLEEVIVRANNTNYGLAAGVITKDLNTALLFSQAVEAGSVWVNCFLAFSPHTPFGGYKESGIGRELGPNSVENYMESKTINIRLPSKV